MFTVSKLWELVLFVVIYVRVFFVVVFMPYDAMYVLVLRHEDFVVWLFIGFSAPGERTNAADISD